jgi:hypothetical protein
MVKRAFIATDAIKESDAIAQLNSKRSGDNKTATATIATDTVEPSSPEQSLSPEQQSESAPILRLTADQLSAAISAAVDTALTPMRSELQTTRDQLTAAEKQNESLEALFKVIGKPASVVHSPGRGDRVSGLAADFLTACESAPAASWINKRTGERIVQRDMSAARSLFFSDRDQLRRDMEKFAKDHGFLRGIVASDAATLKTDVLPALLDYLSMTMRETHRGRYVYWQFPFYELELGKGPGDTIQVGRLRWITEATAIADRTLTPGTNLTANRQNITIGQVSIVLAERGLGSGSPSTSQPIAVPEFVSAYSMISLENAVGKVLGHDYEAWEDLSIRSRYAATTRIVYNNRQSVTTNPLLVNVGADGTITEQFLNELYAYMSGLQIPTLDDGTYVLVLHDKALAQFKNTLRSRNQYLDQANMEELTMMLQAVSNREQGKVSGYAGVACGFQIFSTNAHSMGAAGTEGVRTETLGAGGTLTRSSYAFGAMAVARAQGMQAEIRADNVNDFGRLQSFTWLSHETPGYLDVDPAIAADQQLRSIEIRTVDTAV